MRTNFTTAHISTDGASIVLHLVSVSSLHRSHAQVYVPNHSNIFRHSNYYKDWVLVDLDFW